jgi:hypothetical protein
MTVNQLRSLLYKLARGLGDVQSVRRGTVHKRVARRVAGRQTGRALRRMLR